MPEPMSDERLAWEIRNWPGATARKLLAEVLRLRAAERTWVAAGADALSQIHALQAERAAMLPRYCSVCAGQPFSDGRQCICGGGGTEEHEIRGLRLGYARLLERGSAGRARGGA